jgi:cbb3-type cytochrome c oxidase subunit III
MPDRIARRQRMLAACLAAACAALVAGGCGGGSSDKKTSAKPHTTPRPAFSASQIAAGEKVFRKYCANCHSIADRISHPTFVESPIPNFNEVKPEPDYIRARVEGGGIDMPSLTGELSRAQIQQVLAYVYTASGREIEAGKDPSASLSTGEQLFRANCQACHSIAGRRANGHPAYPGTDFNDVRPSAKLVMRLVRRGIPDEMPSFRRKLTDAQIRAVATYVTSTAGR